MDNETIKKELNKVFENMGSSAAGIVGIESLPLSKKKEEPDDTDDIET